MKTIIIESKKHCNRLHTSLLLAILGGTLYPVLTLAETGAKSMFADDTSSVMMSNDSAPPSPQIGASKQKKTDQTNSDYANTVSDESDNVHPVSYAGVQYWIDLQEPNGQFRKVTTNHVFHSGDGIKLQVKSKTQGYLYIINQDATGQVTSLYPAPGQDSGIIQPNIMYTIPSHGAIRFNNVPGIEKVTIALAKYQLPSPSISAPTTTNAANVAYGGDEVYNDCANNQRSAGSKGMFSEESGGGSSMDCIRKNHSVGSKGMFTEEDAVSAEPASYAVVPSSSLDVGNVLFVDFNLTHR